MDYGVYDVLKKYIHLVQSEGPDAHRIATEIGKIAMNKPALAENLEKLLTPENCQKGMKAFLAVYDDSKVLKLAEEIGATGTLISDISNLFSVEYTTTNATAEKSIATVVRKRRYAKSFWKTLYLKISCANSPSPIQ